MYLRGEWSGQNGLFWNNMYIYIGWVLFVILSVHMSDVTAKVGVNKIKNMKKIVSSRKSVGHSNSRFLHYVLFFPLPSIHLSNEENIDDWTFRINNIRIVKKNLKKQEKNLAFGESRVAAPTSRTGRQPTMRKIPILRRVLMEGQ